MTQKRQNIRSPMRYAPRIQRYLGKNTTGHDTFEFTRRPQEKLPNSSFDFTKWRVGIHAHTQFQAWQASTNRRRRVPGIGEARVRKRRLARGARRMLASCVLIAIANARACGHFFPRFAEDSADSC